MAEYHPLRTRDQDPVNAVYVQQNTEAEVRAKQCRSAKMPSLVHLRMQDYKKVYEPSEDTFLLIDAIGMDIDLIDKEWENSIGHALKRSNIRRTLEIGCGTAVPSVYLAMRLGSNVSDRDTFNHRDVIHFVTDINLDAVRIAKSTAEANGISDATFKAIHCDLATDLLPTLENKIDILIFNPPYVPTADDDVGSNGIEASWAGGMNGRAVIDRALPQIAQLLSYPHGVGYLVTVDNNHPEELSHLMMTNYGLISVPWMRRRASNEFLTVLRLTPTRRFQAMPTS